MARRYEFCFRVAKQYFTMLRVPCNLVARAPFPGFGGAREKRPGDEVGSLE